MPAPQEPFPRRPAGALANVAIALAVLASTSPLPAPAQDPSEVHAELLFGTAWSLPMPLVVSVPGEASLRVRARYATRPLADAPYYAWRVGGGRLAANGAPAGWEAELLHHKLYLERPPPPIAHFEVTHGYNLAMASVVRPAGRVSFRASIGVVVAHAEGSIAGRRVGGSRRTFLGGGYHLAGLTMHVAAGRRYALGRGRTSAYVVPEGKLTASVARVPLGDDGGRVVVPNVAAHLLAGMGVTRRRH